MRRRALIAAAVVFAVALGFGLYWFAPWRLLTSTTVTEALSTPSPATSASQGGPRLLAEGTFITHEHETTGTARIVRLPDGTHRLELAGLATSDGPDLRVWLTDQPVLPGRPGWKVFDDGNWLELGKLKGNRGDQTYPLPPTADPAAFRSVTIWCKRFSVSFGAAPLVA